MAAVSASVAVAVAVAVAAEDEVAEADDNKEGRRQQGLL